MTGRKKTLHIVGQAHLDPVWLWRWRDGCSEALATMQSAVDRMAETPGFHFTRSSAATYRWVQETDPRLFDEIRARVKEGRWEVTGGWIVQPDCNIPSTESFVRQCLYGRTYFARELGVEVGTGYNVDSFGHAGGLPQILARAGYENYVFMRPQPHEMDLPKLFWWEGPDGSRVLCWRIQGAYCQGAGETVDALETKIRNAAEGCFAPGFEDGCFFLGVGDHGGGPTKRQIAKVLELREEFAGDESLPRLRFSTLCTFFEAVRRSPKAGEIPVVARELQHHATGCYSAMGEIKMLNRRAERSLVRAETLAVMAGLGGEPAYPADELREAWWKLLFGQFHDILAGSSIEPAYRDARDSVGSACEAADRTAVGAVHVLARRVDTSGAPGGVLFLANTLPWRRKAPVSFDVAPAPDGEREITHLEAQSGARSGRGVPLQWTTPEAIVGPGWRKLNAVVELPACGYRALHLASGEAPPACAWEAAVETRENALGFASLRATGGIEILAGPVGFVVIDDTSDTWGHGVDEYRTEAGRPKLVSASPVEDGPVLRTVRQTASWGTSEIALDVTTYREIDAVELRVRTDWRERHQILKLEVPTAFERVRSFARTAGGVTEREPNGHEEPCQDWVALEGHVGGELCSLGLVNDGIYSYDCLGGLLRTVIVRSAPFAHHGPTPLPEGRHITYLDQGRQERRLWLVWGEGGHRELGLERLADELQTPAEHAVDSAHPGAEPWEKAFVEVQPASVAVTAVKRAEDGRGIVVRVQEMRGEETGVRVSVPDVHAEWEGAVGPWEIRTLLIEPRPGDAALTTEVDLLERPVR